MPSNFSAHELFIFLWKQYKVHEKDKYSYLAIFIVNEIRNTTIQAHKMKCKNNQHPAVNDNIIRMVTMGDTQCNQQVNKQHIVWVWQEQ
jgi:hypothetical protein